jgi:hypothetical protein
MDKLFKLRLSGGVTKIIKAKSEPEAYAKARILYKKHHKKSHHKKRSSSVYGLGLPKLRF